MIRHKWTMACARALVDRFSNNVTLVDIIETLTVYTSSVTERIVVSVGLDVVVLVERDNANVPAQGQIRVSLVGPDNELVPFIDDGVYFVAEVDLTETPRSRMRLRLGNIVLNSTGPHSFVTEIQQEGSEEWTKEGRYDFTVTHEDIAQVPDPAPPQIP